MGCDQSRREVECSHCKFGKGNLTEMSTPEQILEILESGDLSRLKGVFEDERVEFKKQPYSLASDSDKIELAKDVTALANAAGGVIVLGVKTALDQSHPGEHAELVRPFEQARVDPTRYHKIIENWVFPALDDLEIKWYESAESPGTGLVALFVSPAEAPAYPVLVKKSVVDEGKVKGHLFGYFERRQDRSIHLSVERLQSLIRDGRRLDEEFRDGIQSLHAMIEELRDRSVSAEEEERSTALRKGIESAVRAVGLEDSPAFILWASPQTPVELHGLFESSNSDVVQLLERPPEIRGSGFDLDAGGKSRLVEGRLRRALVPQYKLLEAWRDGTLVYVMQGDNDGLSWRRKSDQERSLILNQLVLLETTFLFFRLIDEIRQSTASRSQATRVGAHLRRMNVDGNPCILQRGVLNQWRSIGAVPAPKGDAEFEIEWFHENEEPPDATYRLVANIYHWFGIENEGIPYTEQKEGHRFISQEFLIAAG